MTQAAQPQPVPSLPDINAQTYPFEMVQALLDRAAYFNLLSVPSKGTSAIYGPSGGVIGWRISENLHRFDAGVHAPTAAAGLKAANLVGEKVAFFQHRWLMIAHDFKVLPGGEPPPTPFDPSRSQRFVMLDSVCRFGDGADSFRGIGTGLTYPTAGGELHAGAIGTLLEGFGKFAGLEKTTYVYCGVLTRDGGFQGNLMVRAMDPEGVLRTKSGLPPIEPLPDPEPGVTYVVFHGQKKGPQAKTVYRYGPDGQIIGLRVQQQVMLFPIDCSVRGRNGLESRSSFGQVVGRMTSNIDFNLLNPGAPGTALAPMPFGAVNTFTLTDDNGQILGTFVGDGGEGRTFNMMVDGAPGQPGLRFGGVGPLRNGTGRFAGIKGLMTDNSVVGLAPHVTCTLYVLRIDDPDGKYRAALGGSPPAPRSKAPPAPEPAVREPFRELVAKKEAFTETYLTWRRDFKKRADLLGRFIAETYNGLRGVGDFTGLEIDPDRLAAVFGSDPEPFDPVSFERYAGTARGVFKFYDVASRSPIDSAAMERFCHWDPETVKVGQRLAKQITDSHQGYFALDAVPPLEEGKVDLLVNSYHPDTGVTGWVSMFQLGRAERASISYKLPGNHAVLRIVKDVSRFGQLLENDLYMASHEWREERGGKVFYPMIGIFFRIDFEAGTVSVFGDRFWRVRYEEEEMKTDESKVVSK